MEYYIYITNDCNMNCEYCSVLFDTKKHGIPMEPQYTFAELEYFITKNQQILNDDVADIYFFGGEPTVDYKKIEKLIEAFNKPHEYKINYIMHTNGLLIPKAPKHILEQISLTLLSFNYELIYKNGHITPYLSEMIKAIECIKDAKNTPIIGRITVSPNTSLFTECCLISCFVDYVYWQIDNCEFMKNFDSYQAQYKYDISLLFKYWIKHLENGIFLRFVPFMSVVRNIIAEPEMPSKFYCGYGNSMIYVQTNGKCYACCDNVATNSHYIGDIYTGIHFSNNDLNQTICKDCTYIKLCGGRCGRMHKDFTIKRINQYCDLNKYMFNLIQENIEQIQYIISENPSLYNKIMDPMIAYTEYTA